MTAPLPMVDVEALTRLAQAATAGDWRTTPSNTEWDALMTPDVLEALLGRLRTAEADADRLAAELPHWVPAYGGHVHTNLIDASRAALAAHVVAVEARP